MRRIIYLISIIALASCLNLRESNPYKESLRELDVKLIMPSDFEGVSMEQVEVELTELNSNARFVQFCSSEGIANFKLPVGVYRATVSSLIAGEQFNASKSGIVLSESHNSCELDMIYVKSADILIKEIYCGGCTKAPKEGTYNRDAYIILHNNSNKTYYLDSLCFGCLDPYNSNSTPVWGSEIDFAPIIQAIWQFEGSGQSLGLEPGADAVIAVHGAIDHAEQFPQSVNLNNSGYFAMYNNTYFTDVEKHLSPGDKIKADHILKVVVKMGIATSYTLSINSPAVVIFKAQGCSIEEFLAVDGSIVQKPSSSDRIAKIPYDWVLDGVEVFNGQSATNKKRLGPIIDASAIILSNTYEAKTLMRKVDAERSASAGYERLVDTNNSSSDFYESPIQSLHDEQ